MNKTKELRDEIERIDYNDNLDYSYKNMLNAELHGRLDAIEEVEKIVKDLINEYPAFLPIQKLKQELQKLKDVKKK